MNVVLVSTYELGRQPFGLASPAAWLRDAGVEVRCADVSREPLDDDVIAAAGAIGLYLPMHTATRLALPLLERIRRVNRAGRVCAFGVYAPLNATALRERGVEAIFGGEFEEALTRWIVTGMEPSTAPPTRLRFRVPDRTGLPRLDRYAALQLPDGSRRVAGYTEASRGCKHWCRHCPIVPVYGGRFRVVDVDVVMADIRAQVEAGAQHITFGDPDFFNGIGHARKVIRTLSREYPGLTYDVTIKVEHLLQHADALPVLADTSCLFVTSAAEAVDDGILARLDKGHTRADFERAVEACRAAGVALAPTFVPFTPWTTLEGYRELLDAIHALDLVANVAPIQLAIRLLIPNGSRLLELDEVRRVVGPFDPQGLVYAWTHADPRVDKLQTSIETLVRERTNAPRQTVFAEARRLAYEAAEIAPPPPQPPLLARAAVPFLTEPWYC
ncbi:MAG TPA: CUAEP/CCAEP-tail radical SAM protein [Vicinamibacterales bacterium]|nr:CUAEP/CCAEP-tail radical SAM protein [Vicinamibacterales bacterium]